MKTTKLMCAALALVAFAACNKQEVDTVLTSSNKAVSLTISNLVSESKAVAATTPVANGGTATIENQAAAGACAETDDLVVLLANASGNVVEAKALFGETATEGTYTWHNVDASVTQVAVVRVVKEDGTYNVTADDFVGDALSTYSSAAGNEDAHEQVDLAKMNLYVAADLSANGTCEVPNEHDNTTWTYNLYTANVTLAPALARVEIVGIKCTDLGSANADNDATTSGYDELELESIIWGTNAAYEYTFNNADVLKGTYKNEALVAYTPGENKAITWNIAPAAAVPSTAAPMTLSMTASAHDYSVVTPVQTLTINGFEGISNFEAGTIYRLNLEFTEDNLDETNEAICVEVTVEIANWVVVDVTPTFAN